ARAARVDPDPAARLRPLGLGAAAVATAIAPRGSLRSRVIFEQAARRRRLHTAGSGRKRLAKDPEPVSAQDRLEPVAVVAALPERGGQSRELLRAGEALQSELRLGGLSGCGLV